jgi:hypothetical protein
MTSLTPSACTRPPFSAVLIYRSWRRKQEDLPAALAIDTYRFCHVLSHPETENFITLEILAFGSFLFIIEYFILN